MYSALPRNRLCFFLAVILPFIATVANGEGLTTKLSAGVMAKQQHCSGCVDSHYQLIPIGLSLRRGTNSLKLATSFMQLERPALNECYSGYSELLITLAHDKVLLGRRYWGSEVKLKLPTESEPELGNGSTDLELGLKGMIGVGPGWLGGKLSQRWRQGAKVVVYDTRSAELSFSSRIGVRGGLGLRAIYKDKSASIDVPERTVMPYLSFSLNSQQRATLYVLHSEQGSTRGLGGGLHFSFRL